MRPVPAFAHPKDLAVRRTDAAPTARLRPNWRSVAVAVGLTAVALSIALAVTFGRGQSTIVRPHLGPGYPEHHGLAGPSQVGPSVGSWLGYPPHFGLAGPSQVGPTAVPIGIGAGYPPHYGLAGPSHVDDGR
jgi:hypothetical protein